MKKNKPTLSAALVLIPVLGICLLAGCGKTSSPKLNTQVAARVGSEEISVHQVNALLALNDTRDVSPDHVKVLSRALLEGLIDQQMAIDKAVDTKLDRTPEVIAKIEAARREVLAAAYVRHFAASVPKTTEQEAKKYFADHPALFAERRIFNVQEIVVPRTPEVLNQLTRLASANASMEAVAAWLKGNKSAFSTGTATRSADQIPAELLQRMHTLQDGQDAIFFSTDSITILRLVASQKAPIPEPAALPRIATYLTNQRIASAVSEHIKALRLKAKVVYEGEFVPSPLATDTVLKATTATPPQMPVVEPSAPDSGTLAKGVAGLK